MELVHRAYVKSLSAFTGIQNWKAHKAHKKATKPSIKPIGINRNTNLSNSGQVLANAREPRKLEHGDKIVIRDQAYRVSRRVP